VPKGLQIVKGRMNAVMLGIALVANDFSPKATATPRAERVATAAVTILAAEEIRFRHTPIQPLAEKGAVRQYRQRGTMTLIEFY
jgi:hypothetical protein